MSGPILRTLLRYGAHRAGIGPLISSPPVPYLGKWRAEKDNDREPDPPHGHLGGGWQARQTYPAKHCSLTRLDAPGS